MALSKISKTANNKPPFPQCSCSLTFFYHHSTAGPAFCFDARRATTIIFLTYFTALANTSDGYYFMRMGTTATRHPPPAITTSLKYSITITKRESQEVGVVDKPLFTTSSQYSLKSLLGHFLILFKSSSKSG
jgi:hypothetical protein